MRKTVHFQRALCLALFVLFPFISYAQDMMTFSENEVDDSKTDTNSDDEGGANEDSSVGEEGASDADLLSVLGEEDGVEAGGEISIGASTKKEGEETVELSHPIWAVQQVYALRKGRLDFQPSFGVSMNDPYVQHQSINLSASWYITEVLAIGASFNYYGFLDAETDLNHSVSLAAHQTVPINEYLLGGQLNFTYVPMYGKFALMKEWILHWDVWVLGGGGFIMTRPIPVIDPDYREFDFTTKFSFNLGIGGRLFLTRFLAIVVELRDYIYPEQLESRNIGRTQEDREVKSKWLDKELALTNNVMLHFGVSMFIPFTFDYKLPK